MFLQETAHDIYAKYGTNLNHVCFVVPNKRAGVYFKKFYAEAAEKVMWSPKVYPINYLVQKFSGLHSADRLTMLFLIFDIYNKHAKETIDFERFISLGETLISDFSEIDSYLADPTKVFHLVKDMDEIERVFDFLGPEEIEVLKRYWRSFSLETQSAQKEWFINLWSILPDVYKSFTDSLLEEKAAYDGLKYREIARQIDAGELKNDNFETYIFIGFNALNRGEQKLFDHLNKLGKARFYWDGDEFLVKKDFREAGFFLRQNLKMFGNSSMNKLTNNFSSSKKTLKLIGCSGSTSQIKTVSQVLQNEGVTTQNMHRSAVVLTDENLLLPLLQSVPTEYTPLNATMGFPFKITGLQSFLNVYFAIQQQLDNGKNQISAKQLISLLNRPELFAEPDIQQLKATFEDAKREYISVIDFKSFNKVTEIALKKSENSIELLNNLQELLYRLFIIQQNNEKTQAELETEASPEAEYIFVVYKEIKRLYELFSTHKNFAQSGLKAAIRIIKSLLASLSVPFTGQVGEGLQLMGMLETRNIDFENVVIVGMNDGVYPATGKRPSFIPENLRFVFDLPQRMHKEAIQAYYFYRLISRAKNTVLLYDNVGGSKSSEPSRYIMQLRNETPITVTEINLAPEVKPIAGTPIEIPKNDDIQKKLSNYLVGFTEEPRRFSASALNTYLKCKLQFYFKYVAKIRVKQVIDPDVDAPEFGIVFHHALQLIFEDAAAKKPNKIIEIADYGLLKKQIPAAINRAFKEYLELEDHEIFEATKNRAVVEKVFLQLFRNVINYDKTFAPLQIIDLEAEKGYSGKIPVRVNGNTEYAAIYGVIDRIDNAAGKVRIVDYKTGKATKEYRDIESLFDSKSNARKSEVFQTLFYTEIFMQNNPELRNIAPMVYDVRNMHLTKFSGFVKKGTGKTAENLEGNLLLEEMDAYREGLQELVSEIFSTETTFDQTEKKDNCKYCDYKTICGR